MVKADAILRTDEEYITTSATEYKDDKENKEECLTRHIRPAILQ